MFKSVREAELAWVKKPDDAHGVRALTCPYKDAAMEDEYMERLLVALSLHHDVLYIINYPPDWHSSSHGRIQFICRVRE